MRIEPSACHARPHARARSGADGPNKWIAALERSGRRIALVIAGDPLTAAVGELYRAYGYDVIAPATPLDAIQMLVSGGERIGAAVLSSDNAWADGMGELLADEFPEIERILLVA